MKISSKITNFFIVLTLLFSTSSCGFLTAISAAKTIITTNLDRRTIGVIADDEIINLNLEAWAVDDSKLKNSHLNFTVYNKNVLITGEVEDGKLINYIINQIKTRVQINKIFNETIIAQPSSLISRTQDSLIDGKIKIALNNQEVFNPVHINYHTENSVVYLMGDVTKREAKKAGHMIAGVSGVKRVVKYFNYIPHIPHKEIERAKAREQERIKQKQLLKNHSKQGIEFN